MKKVTKQIKEREDLSRKPLRGSDLDRRAQNGEPLGNVNPGGSPIEQYKSNAEADIIKAMQYVAAQCANNAKKDGFNIAVSGVAFNYPISDEIRDTHFHITDKESGDGYTIYRIGSNVMYRPEEEYVQICKDIEDKIPAAGIESLYHEYEDPSKEIDVYSVVDRDDCLFIVYSIISSICGKSYEDVVDFQDNVNELDESCRIRKHNKLGTDGLVKNSKKFHDAKYGTDDENAFKQEIEDKQKQDGTVGALDNNQQQESAFKYKLPNVHMVTESKTPDKFEYDKLRKLGYEDIEYEPGDRVIVGKDKHPGVVTDVWDTVDAGQTITVLLNNGGGMAYVTFEDVLPDPAYKQELCLGMPYTTTLQDRQFNLDMRYRMPDPNMNNDDSDIKFEDMNGRNILCNIVMKDGPYGTQQLGYDYCYASMKDILDGKDTVRVVNESGDVTEWPIENIDIEPENWPYAVVVNDEDGEEPLRKIKIDPVGYIEATDDEFVDCIVAGKLTKMYKKNIKIIS